jgi:hypothetical protein
MKRAKLLFLCGILILLATRGAEYLDSFIDNMYMEMLLILGLFLCIGYVFNFLIKGFRQFKD